MTESVSTLVLSDDAQAAGIIGMFLKELDKFDCRGYVSDLSQAYEIIASAKRILLVVDIDDRTEQKIDFVTKISAEMPDCKVLIVSENPSVELMVKLMRAGAREFVSYPLIKTEFLNSIQKLADSFDAPVKESSRCRIISVFSNKGGIGKTSIATNLALEIAKTTKENVALVDLNFQLGDVTTFLDLKPSFNISYMIENLGKINEDFLLSTLEKYKDTSLYVLADPPFFKMADDVSPKQIDRLITLLSKTFAFIVIDSASAFDDKTITALGKSDLVLLTAVANLPAMRNCQRCLELFSKLGFSNDKIQILINRYMENDEVTSDDVEQVLGKKIYWKIPNNYFTMMSAINKGIPVVELNPSSNVAKSYRDFSLFLTDNIFRGDFGNKLKNNRKDD